MSNKPIVLATQNTNKLRELKQLLGNDHIVAQSHYGVPDAVEDGLSFVENALIKARNASRHSGLAAIADDSGIVVDALDGEPGIYSARYAGPLASDEENWQQLLQRMVDIPDAKRTACFVCSMVYVRQANDPIPLVAQGVWRGRILTRAQGQNGFGYDPIFFVDEKNCTAAELTSDVKNAISHRGQASACLIRQLVELSIT